MNPFQGPHQYGHTVRARRVKQGLGLREFAAQAKLSLVEISDIERNRRRPTPAERLRINDLLGAPPLCLVCKDQKTITSWDGPAGLRRPCPHCQFHEHVEPPSMSPSPAAATTPTLTTTPVVSSSPPPWREIERDQPCESYPYKSKGMPDGDKMHPSKWRDRWRGR